MTTITATLRDLGGDVVPHAPVTVTSSQPVPAPDGLRAKPLVRKTSADGSWSVDLVGGRVYTIAPDRLYFRGFEPLTVFVPESGSHDLRDLTPVDGGGETATFLDYDYVLSLGQQLDGKVGAVNLTGTGIDPTRVTDSTAALNAVLASSAGKYVRGLQGATYKISAPLVVPSGTTLDMTACTVNLVAGSNCNMLQNRAVATSQRALTGVSVTSGSATVTCAGGNFTAADVGRSIVVANGSQPLVGSIAAVTNSTTLQLGRVSPFANLSAAAATVYDRDSKIAVIGGIWNRGGNAGAGPDLHTFRFRHLDGLRASGVTITSTAGKYAVSIADATNFTTVDMTFDTHSDGVHVQGPASNGYLGRFFGRTGDDSAAITAADYPAYNDSVGPVDSVVIENIYTTSAARSVLVNGGSTATSATNVAIRNVYGAAQVYGVMVSDDPAYADTTGGLIDNIVVENVRVLTPAYMVLFNASNLRSVVLDGVLVDDATRTVSAVAFVGVATRGNAIIRNVSAYATGGISTGVVRINGTMDRITLSDSTMILAGTDATPMILVDGAGVVSALSLREIRFKPNSGQYLLKAIGSAVITRLLLDAVVGAANATGGLVQAISTTTSIPAIYATRLALDAFTWIADLATTTVMRVQAAHMTTSGSLLNVRTGGTVTITGNDVTSQRPVVAATGAVCSVRVPGLLSVNTSSARPQGVAGAGLGTGATVTVDGTDASGHVIAVTGAGATVGNIVTITFPVAFTTTPVVNIQPTNTAANAAGLYISAPTTSGFTVVSTATPTGTLTFAYAVVV